MGQEKMVLILAKNKHKKQKQPKKRLQLSISSSTHVRDFIIGGTHRERILRAHQRGNDGSQIEHHRCFTEHQS